VIFGVHNNREWATFCRDVLQRPALADDERFQGNHQRVANRSQMDKEIEAVFSGLSAAEVVERLDRAQIANARMNTIDEFVDHPQLRARDAWRMVASSAGPLPALIPPVRMEGVEPAMDPIPALGEHTDAILGKLGFSPSTIEVWRKDGIV
jgi:itaconate CoA-transferase